MIWGLSKDPYIVGFPEAHAAFPEAFVSFDLQCSDVHGGPDAPKLVFRLYRKVGTYSGGGGAIARDRLTVRIGDGGKQFIWHPAAAVWVRFSIGISAKPYLPPVGFPIYW